MNWREKERKKERREKEDLMLFADKGLNGLCVLEKKKKKEQRDSFSDVKMGH